MSLRKRESELRWIYFRLILLGLVGAFNGCATQRHPSSVIVTKVPWAFSAVAEIMVHKDSAFRTDHGHNAAEAIRRELATPQTILVIAHSIPNAAERLHGVRIKMSSSEGSTALHVYRIDDANDSFAEVIEALENYIRAREEGQTAANVLENYIYRAKVNELDDPFLRAIALYRQDRIAVEKLRRLEEVPTSDDNVRWRTYVLLEGGLAEVITVGLNPDNSFRFIWSQNADPKEYEPATADVIRKAGAQARQELENAGKWGKFGVVHDFWERKKQLLKEQGIEWFSPRELNPHTVFD